MLYACVGKFCKVFCFIILLTAVCTFYDLLHLLNKFLNVTFITTNLQYSLTNGKQTNLHGLFLNQMFNIPVSTFTFSDKIVILPREVHYRGRFTLVHFFHKSPVKVHNHPMIISFSFPASCGLFRNVSCP